MDCGGGGRRQTLATEDGGFLQSAELRIQTTAAEEEISCIPPGHQVLGHLVKGELAEQSDVSFAARDAWQGLLTCAFLTKNSSKSHPNKALPSYRSRWRRSLVSSPPSLDWLWSLVSFLSLLSLLLWPFTANLSRQPSLVFSNLKTQSFLLRSIANRAIAAVNIFSLCAEPWVFIDRNPQLERMWELRSSVHN